MTNAEGFQSSFSDHDQLEEDLFRNQNSIRIYNLHETNENVPYATLIAIEGIGLHSIRELRFDLPPNTAQGAMLHFFRQGPCDHNFKTRL